MAFPVGTPWSGSNPSTAYSGTFIPEVWSGKLVEKFYKATVLGAIANTDYEGEIKNFGDKVQIRSIPTITIRDYSAEIDLVVDRPSEAKQTLEVQADIDQLSIWAEDASEQMKITIDGDVLNGGTAGDGTGVVNNADLNSDNKGNSAGVLSSSVRLGLETDPTHVAKAAVGGGTGADGSNEMAIVDYIVNCGTVLDEQNLRAELA
jgi:hypothetical protein